MIFIVTRNLLDDLFSALYVHSSHWDLAGSVLNSWINHELLFTSLILGEVDRPPYIEPGYRLLLAVHVDNQRSLDSRDTLSMIIALRQRLYLIASSSTKFSTETWSYASLCCTFVRAPSSNKSTLDLFHLSLCATRARATFLKERNPFKNLRSNNRRCICGFRVIILRPWSRHRSRLYWDTSMRSC